MIQKQFVKRISWGVLFLLFVVGETFAQPDCRSILGAHIKPIEGTRFSWSTEAAIAAALMNDRQIANWGAYAAIDYTLSKNQFYFEGAYKNWYNSAANPDGEVSDSSMLDYNKPTRYHLGFREMYYRYGDNENHLKAGIQGIKTADYLLFDERAIGVSALKTFNNVNFSAHIGTVSQRIARFQDVCGNRHIYNIIHRSQFNFVGETPGESNFAGAFLTWKPSSIESINNDFEMLDDDGFEVSSDDEFESFDEFETVESKTEKSFLKLNESGLFFYEEFGSAFHEYKYYSGAFASINLIGNIDIKLELIDQYILNDHAVAYLVEAEKTHTWLNGSSSQFQLGYLGKVDIDKGAYFYPAFTNLFKGEVMRLDAIDLPLLSGTVKHFFPGKLKLNIQLTGISQLNANHSNEFDFITDCKPFKHIRISGIGSYITSDLLETNYWMARLELRIAI